MRRTAAFVLLGALAVLLGCELVLQVLPVSTTTNLGYYQDDAPLILSYPARLRFVASTGWDLRNPQVNQANNVGFVATRDFVPDPNAVALIGDSFVEASMLPMSERPAAQLQALLPSRPIYAMGMPGAALLDYAERMRWASARFGIRDFVVVLESGDLWESLCGSGQGNGPCLDARTFEPRVEKMPEAGWLKRLLRGSALAEYVMGQLKFNPKQLWQQVLAQARPPAQPVVQAHPSEARKSPGADAVAHAFFARIADLHPRRLIFVLDAERAAIYSHGAPLEAPDLVAFAAVAHAHAANVVEAAPVLTQDFAAEGLRFEVGPYDHHMNPLGWRLLMDRVAGELGAPEPSPR